MDNNILSRLDQALKYLKHNRSIKEMCKEYNVSTDALDLIPIRFGDIEVSAKTNHGIVIINQKFLKEKMINVLPYLVHEITHVLQQCYGDRATQGAEEGSYLDNPYEEKGFQYQLQFLDDQFGPQEAHKYVNHLLDHHEVEDPKERSEKKQELMEKVDK